MIQNLFGGRRRRLGGCRDGAVVRSANVSLEPCSKSREQSLMPLYDWGIRPLLRIESW